MTENNERFLILFNSQGANVVSNSNLNQVQYNVNWGGFLPKKYKKFRCQFVFKSVNNNGAILNANGLINMNIGKVNVFDGNSQTYNLGIVYPVLFSSSSSIGAYGTCYQAGTTLTVVSVTSGAISIGSIITINNGNNCVILANGTGTGGVGTYTVSTNANIGNAGAPVNYYASGSNTSFYNSTNNDNNDFDINYPTNQLVSISLRNFDNITPLLSGNGGANTPSSTLHYCLYLSLEGIPNDESLL